MYIFGLVHSAISVIICSFLLQLLVKWLAKFRIRYITALIIVFFGLLAKFITYQIVTFIIYKLKLVFPYTHHVGEFIGFCVQMFIYTKFIKHPETGSIGYIKAFIIIIVILVFMLLLNIFVFSRFLFSGIFP